MSKLQAYIDERKELNLQELIELLKIPSISTDPALAGEVGRCATRMVSRALRPSLREASC